MHKKEPQKLDRKVEWLGEQKVKHPLLNLHKTLNVRDVNHKTYQKWC
jgi:hypothetical protein